MEKKNHKKPVLNKNLIVEIDEKVISEEDKKNIFLQTWEKFVALLKNKHKAN